MKAQRFAVLLALTVLCGCAGLHSASEEEPAQARSMHTHSFDDSHGYALLFGLLGDEKDVSKLLIIKRERAELRDVIRAISESTGRAHAQLEKFAKADRSLNIKDNGLPPAEIEARKTIAKARAKELLTESGKEFEVRLLLSQNEALVYAAHLADAALKGETNQERAQFLRQLSADLTNFQQRVATMLISNYNWPQK